MLYKIGQIIPHGTELTRLHTNELAMHFIEKDGDCALNGNYCKSTLCPIYDDCESIDRFTWACRHLGKNNPLMNHDRPAPMTKDELARHFLKHGGCRKPGRYCYAAICPIHDDCFNIDKLGWAIIQLKGRGNKSTECLTK